MTEVELAIKYLENMVNSQYWSLIENTDDFREIRESILILTKELKSNSILKDKIREIIIEELPDDDICKSCGRYDVNGVVIKQKLIKVLEGE